MITKTAALTILSTLCAGLLLAAATTPVTAREGAQSVGHGIKCYYANVQNADGTYTVQRICYKGV